MDNLTSMFIKLFQSYEKGLLRWEPSFEVLNSYIYDTMEMAHKSGKEESSVENRQTTKPEKPISFIRKDNSPTPHTFDWRHVSGKNYISPVKSQGLCTACSAFAVNGLMEALYNIQHQVPAGSTHSMEPLSEQHLFFFNIDALTGSCHWKSGWTDGTSQALQYAYDYGVLLERDFHTYKPYNERYKPPQIMLPQDWEKKTVKLGKPEHMTAEVYSGDRQSLIKETIYIHGPVLMQIVLANDLLYYKKGIYHDNPLGFKEENSHTQGEFNGYHALLCVGYDEESWICKNSWGSKWGEEGYIRIGFGQCGIEDEFWWVGGLG